MYYFNSLKLMRKFNNFSDNENFCPVISSIDIQCILYIRDVFLIVPKTWFQLCSIFCTINIFRSSGVRKGAEKVTPSPKVARKRKREKKEKRKGEKEEKKGREKEKVGKKRIKRKRKKEKWKTLMKNSLKKRFHCTKWLNLSKDFDVTHVFRPIPAIIIENIGKSSKK